MAWQQKPKTIIVLISQQPYKVYPLHHALEDQHTPKLNESIKGHFQSHNTWNNI